MKDKNNSEPFDYKTGVNDKLETFFWQDIYGVASSKINSWAIDTLFISCKKVTITLDTISLDIDLNKSIHNYKEIYINGKRFRRVG